MGDALNSDELAVYTRVLKIAPDKCPPNHYDLLDVRPDEKDIKQIAVAAQRQVVRLRNDVPPELLREARIVLKRIQRAVTCLQDPHARASYDFALTGESNSAATESIWDELDANSIEAQAQNLSVDHAANKRAATSPPLRTNSPQLTSFARGKRAPPKNGLKYAIAGSLLGLTVVLACIAVWFSAEKAEIKTDQVRAEPMADAKAPPKSKTDETAALKSSMVSSGQVPSESQNAVAPESLAPKETQADGLVSFQVRDKQIEQDTITGSNLNRGGSKEAASTAELSGKPAPSAPATSSLASLSIATDLPAQRAQNSGLTSNEKPEDATIELGLVPTEGLSITLDQPQEMAVEGISFDITSDPSSGIGTAWVVRLRSEVQADQEQQKSSLDNVGAGLDEIVARIFIEDGKLRFAWTNSKYAQLSDQLRNCVLCLSYAQQTHRMQLRSVQKIAPVSLTFEKSVLTFNVAGESLPSSDAVFLNVQPSSALMKSVSMEPSTGTAAVNKLVTLKVSGEKEEQIEIRVTLKKTTNGFFVAVGPRYRIGASWKPFTTEQVNEGLNGLETALVRDRDGLEVAKSAVPSLTSSISSAQSRLSSTSDAREQNFLKIQIRGLQVRLNRAQQTIGRKERDIPDTEHDIELMKKLVAVGNRLRGYTELGIRVGVKTANGEFDLLRTE